MTVSVPDVRHLLVDTVDVERPAYTMSRGNATEALQPHLSAIPFRKRATTAQERMTAEAQQTFATHVGYALPDADLRRQDEVVYADGTRYRVTVVLPPSLPHHLKLLLEEVQRG